jgi:hypothetical protein
MVTVPMLRPVCVYAVCVRVCMCVCVHAFSLLYACVRLRACTSGSASLFACACGPTCVRVPVYVCVGARQRVARWIDGLTHYCIGSCLIRAIDPAVGAFVLAASHLHRTAVPCLLQYGKRRAVQCRSDCVPSVTCLTCDQCSVRLCGRSQATLGLSLPVSTHEYLVSTPEYTLWQVASYTRPELEKVYCKLLNEFQNGAPNFASKESCEAAQ